MNSFRTIFITGFIAGGVILGTLEAEGKTFSIKCKVSGLSEKSKKYETITEGRLVVDEQTLIELEENLCSYGSSKSNKRALL